MHAFAGQCGRSRLRRSWPLCLAAAATLLPPPAPAAETYPARPVRFIVTFPPGGGLDLVARIAAQGLAERWGQQVVVDNRVGAGGTIGTAVAAKMPPDGYTVLFVSSSHAINPSIHRNLPYDTERDFDPVTLTTLVPHLLVVHPSFPVRSVKELISIAKAKPGGITYASGGVGSSTHLAGELLKSLAGIDLVHVPYKGIGPALNDVVSGQIPVTISSVPSVIGAVRAGRLRAIGVTGAKPTASAPEYPPIAAAGVPGYEAAGWHGALAPRGTPPALVARLQRDIAAVLTAEATRERLARDGVDVLAGTPEQFGQQIRADIQRWARIVKAAGIPAE